MADWTPWKPIDLHGWNLDGIVLPDRNGNVSVGTYDAFFPHSESDVAALIYGIGEVRLSVEVGRLAVFRHKENPVVILTPKFKCLVADDTVQWNWDGNILFVKAYFVSYPFAVIDLDRHLFSFISAATDLSAHEIRQEDDRTFTLVDYINGLRPYRRDVRLIKLDEMKWFGLDRLDDSTAISEAFSSSL